MVSRKSVVNRREELRHFVRDTNIIVSPYRVGTGGPAGRSEIKRISYGDPLIVTAG
jgi:hypothetical protein